MSAPDGDAGRPRPLRLAIAGFGRLAQRYYVPALRRLGGIGAIAVADPLTASRAAASASLPGVETCADPRALLERAPDALLVASPPSTHLALWNDAARAGVPVFMEKPFVLGDEIERAESAPAARRLLMVDFNRRFWPVYQRLGALARGGAIGVLGSVELVLHVDVAPWCSVTAHRLSPHEGGVLYDLGSQALDLVRWLLGEDPVRVEVALASRRWAGDHVRLHLGFASGLDARCDLAYGDRSRESVTLEGERGRLTLSDPNVTIHLERRGSRARTALARGRDLVVFGYRGIRRARSMARYSITASLAAFLAAVRADGPLAPGFEDAATNARWLEAAARAAARGGPVALPAGGGSA